MSNNECLRCQAPMEEGFVVDRGHGNIPMDVATWTSGTPQKSWFTGIKTKGHEQIPLSSYLCRRCGYVEFRAASTVTE
jgi:hypothetical protein